MLRFFAKRLRDMQEVSRDERGFTLIELLVVIIIIGVLAAIAIPAFLAQRERSWEATAQSDLRNAAAAATSCSVQAGGSFAACGTEAQLTANGWNKTAAVTYNNVTATATEWAATTVHNNDTTVYTFDTAGPTPAQTGQVYCSANCP
jgi:type IV pilus assembly protein PilA